MRKEFQHIGILIFFYSLNILMFDIKDNFLFLAIDLFLVMTIASYLYATIFYKKEDKHIFYLLLVFIPFILLPGLFLLFATITHPVEIFKAGIFNLLVIIESLAVIFIADKSPKLLQKIVSDIKRRRMNIELK